MRFIYTHELHVSRKGTGKAPTLSLRCVYVSERCLGVVLAGAKLVMCHVAECHSTMRLRHHIVTAVVVALPWFQAD